MGDRVDRNVPRLDRAHALAGDELLDEIWIRCFALTGQLSCRAGDVQSEDVRRHAGSMLEGQLSDDALAHAFCKVLDSFRNNLKTGSKLLLSRVSRTAGVIAAP
jgi:hypothetical protein